jgi:hypothetical protein
MKILWLAIPVVFLVLWMVRRSNNQKARSRS